MSEVSSEEAENIDICGRSSWTPLHPPNLLEAPE